MLTLTVYICMWDYTAACVVNEQQTEQLSLKCREVYTSFVDPQQTSTAESDNAAMHVQAMTKLHY